MSENTNAFLIGYLAIFSILPLAGKEEASSGMLEAEPGLTSAIKKDDAGAYEILLTSYAGSLHARNSRTSDASDRDLLYYEIFKLQFDYWILCYKLGFSPPSELVERSFGMLNRTMLDDEKFKEFLKRPSGFFDEEGRFLKFKYQIRGRTNTFEVDEIDQFDAVRGQFVEFLTETTS